MLEQFPCVYASRPSEVARFIAQNIDSGSSKGSKFQHLVDRSALAGQIRLFHSSAGTLTDAISHQIELYTHGQQCVRVAHQANTFAYLGVYAQFWLLEAVRNQLAVTEAHAPCLLYLIPDFDNAGDSRFRVNRIPDVTRRDGWSLLASPISDKNMVQYAVPRPPRKVVLAWFERIRDYAHKQRALLRALSIKELSADQIEDWLTGLWDDIWSAYLRSNTLSEFNAFFASRLLNMRWNIPVMFLPLSSALPHLVRCYDALLDIHDLLTEVTGRVVDRFCAAGIEVSSGLTLQPDKLPFWYICPSCSSRCTLLKIKTGVRHSVQTHCHVCSATRQFELTDNFLSGLVEVGHRVAPRVLIDDLSDFVGFGIAGGIGYIGNTEHVLVSSSVAAHLGWPAPPECLWRPEGYHFGMAEIIASCSVARGNAIVAHERIDEILDSTRYGKSSIIYYLLSQGTEGLYAMWRSYFARDSSLNEPCLGSPRFALPSDCERFLLERSRLATT